MIPRAVLMSLVAMLCALACGCAAPPPEAEEHAADEHEAEAGHEEAEGHLTLAPEAIANGDIRVGVAAPRAIEERVEAPGEVRLDAERVVQVRPRFDGVLQKLEHRIGDIVSAGDLLAVVLSNESLTEYEILSPMRGTVVARDAAPGQSVEHESVLYTIADLSSVWVDFALYPQLAGRIRRGQNVVVRSAAGAPSRAAGEVGYVGPLLEQDTRVSYGRVVLANPSGQWPPGLFVTVAVTLSRTRVLVAVPEEAIVRMADGPAVFRAHGIEFELQPVVVGRSDGDWTEISRGLEAGDSVVVRNAFLLKAELGKSGAGHEH